jgi:hypothetical protein
MFPALEDLAKDFICQMLLCVPLCNPLRAFVVKNYLTTNFEAAC